MEGNGVVEHEKTADLINEINTLLTFFRSKGKARMKVLDGTILSYENELGNMKNWENDKVLDLHEALVKAELIVKIDVVLKLLKTQEKSTANVLGRTVARYAKNIGTLKNWDHGGSASAIKRSSGLSAEQDWSGLIVGT